MCVFLVRERDVHFGTLMYAFIHIYIILIHYFAQNVKYKAKRHSIVL